MLYGTRGSSLLTINYIELYGTNQGFRGVCKPLKKNYCIVPPTQPLGMASPLTQQINNQGLYLSEAVCFS